MTIKNPVSVKCVIPESLLADLRVFVVMHGGKIEAELKNDEVTIISYGKEEKMNRLEAIAFYEECAQCTEGAEHERYESILCDLRAGNAVCTDLF